MSGEDSLFSVFSSGAIFIIFMEDVRASRNIVDIICSKVLMGIDGGAVIELNTEGGLTKLNINCWYL